MFLLVSFLSSCLCFLLIVAPLCAAGTPGLDELIVDQSCKNFKQFGDVTNDLNQAYADAKMLAKDAHTRIDNLRKTLNGATGLLSNTEILRLERLMAAFFIGPFGDAHQAPLGRQPNNPGWEQVSADLLENIGTIDSLGISTLPPIFCEPPILTQEEAKDLTLQQKKGKWVKITKITDPKGGPDTDVIDPKTGKPSFFYADYLNSDGQGPTNSLVIGEDPCADGAYAATKTSRHDNWILWCQNGFAANRKVKIPTAGDAAQHTDYSTFAWKFSAQRRLDYWRNSNGVTMLHEMHHVYIDKSTDIVVKIVYPSQRQIRAYGYVGCTQLAENVRVSSNWEQLRTNADSMAIWAVGAYLDGCDWSLSNANGLSKIKDVVPSPPPGGIGNRALKTADGSSANELYRRAQVSAAQPRIERRYAEKKARQMDRFGIENSLVGRMPVSPIAGRDI